MKWLVLDCFTFIYCLFTYPFCLHVWVPECMHVHYTCAGGACEEERTLATRELKVTGDSEHHMGAGNPTWFLYKTSSILNHWTISMPAIKCFTINIILNKVLYCWQRLLVHFLCLKSCLLFRQNLKPIINQLSFSYMKSDFLDIWYEFYIYNTSLLGPDTCQGPYTCIW